MEILANLFYFTGFIFVLFFGYMGLSGYTLSRLSEEIDEDNYPFVGCIIIIHFLWVLIGLCTDQWLFFLGYVALIAVGSVFSKLFNYHKIVVGVAYMLLTIAIAMIIFNHFHIHYYLTLSI